MALNKARRRLYPFRQALLIIACITILMLSASAFSHEAGSQPPPALSETSARSIAEDAAEKAVEKATEKAIEKSVEQAAQKAAEKAVEKVTESAAVQAVTKQATANAKLQAEQTAMRPDEWRGPTRVRFLVFVIDIDAIDDANQNFTGNIFIRLRWRDRRLAHPGSPVRQIPLDAVWNPRVLLANRTGLISKALPDVVQVESDGTVTYYQRYTGKLSQPLRLSEFPMDKHTFFIQFAAAGYSADELEFIPDSYEHDPLIRGGGISDVLSLPDWKILEHEALPLTYSPIKQIHAAGFGFRFVAERYIAYYLWQVVLPMAVVVVMSWAAFWVGRENVGVRIGVATSSVLTLIANRFVFASLLPRLPYMTRMDYFTVGSTLLVFLALFMVVLVAFLATKGKVWLARKLDLWSRALFPLSFLLLFIWFISK